MKKRSINAENMFIIGTNSAARAPYIRISDRLWIILLGLKTLSMAMTNAINVDIISGRKAARDMVKQMKIAEKNHTFHKPIFLNLTIYNRIMVPRRTAAIIYTNEIDSLTCGLSISNGSASKVTSPVVTVAS